MVLKRDVVDVPSMLPLIRGEFSLRHHPHDQDVSLFSLAPLYQLIKLSNGQRILDFNLVEQFRLEYKLDSKDYGNFITPDLLISGPDITHDASTLEWMRTPAYKAFESWVASVAFRANDEFDGGAYNEWTCGHVARVGPHHYNLFGNRSWTYELYYPEVHVSGNLKRNLFITNARDGTTYLGWSPYNAKSYADVSVSN